MMPEYFENFNLIQLNILQQIRVAIVMRHRVVSSKSTHFTYSLLSTDVDFDNVL